MKNSIISGVKTGTAVAAAILTCKALCQGGEIVAKKIKNWRENRQREKQEEPAK